MGRVEDEGLKILKGEPCRFADLQKHRKDVSGALNCEPVRLQ